MITGLEVGGQLMTTTEVDNWPGDVHGLMGPDLMARMQKHAERFDTQMIYDHIHVGGPRAASRSSSPATRASTPATR